MHNDQRLRRLTLTVSDLCKKFKSYEAALWKVSTDFNVALYVSFYNSLNWKCIDIKTSVVINLHL